MAIVTINLPSLYVQDDYAVGDFFLRAFLIEPDKVKPSSFFDKHTKSTEQVPKSDLIIDTDKYVYKDMTTHMKAHPLTGDLTRSYDAEAVKNSIKNIVLTEYGERPFGETFGTAVKSSLFEPLSDITGQRLKTRIEDAIYNYEPRVELLQVVVLPLVDANQYEIMIKFTLRTSNQQAEFGFFLERT